MPIIPRPGEATDDAIARSVRAEVTHHECTSEAGNQQVTERWSEVDLYPDVVRVLLHHADWVPDWDNLYFRLNDGRVFVTAKPVPGPGPFVEFELEGEVCQ